MLKLISIRYQISASLLLWLLGAVSIPPILASQAQIPEATKPCTADEAKWWQELRTAGHNAVAARLSKDKAARQRSIELYGQVMSDPERFLSKKELDKLNADIAASKAKFISLLKEGQEKSYRAPIPDRRPIILHASRPSYSEEARSKKVGGVVMLKIEVLADGTVGEVKVVRGLGHGLDEKASESVRESTFLPAVKDGLFISYWIQAEVEFNIR